MEWPSRAGPSLRIGPHDALTYERFENYRLHTRAEDNALRMKIIVGCELEEAIFLDLYM
jgi:hypothetical protein